MEVLCSPRMRLLFLFVAALAQDSPSCAALTQRSCFGQTLVPEEAEVHRELLRVFNTAMVGAGARYMLSNGNLLGFARTGSRIPWDDDIDVMLPAAAIDYTNQNATQVLQLNPVWQPVMLALKSAGLEVGPFLSVKVRGRPFFKVYFPATHASVLRTLPASASKPARSYPFIDVFVDSPDAIGGECKSCWPTRPIQYEGITVQGPLNENMDSAITSLFGQPALEVRTMCYDNCISHCQGYQHNCFAESCIPRTCADAYSMVNQTVAGNVRVSTAPAVPNGTMEATPRRERSLSGGYDRLRGSESRMSISDYYRTWENVPTVLTNGEVAIEATPTVLAWVIVAVLAASVLGVVYLEADNLRSLETMAPTLAVFVYIALTTICDIFIQMFSSHGAFGFYPQVLVASCEFGKLCVCSTVIAAMGYRCTSEELLATFKRMAIPAACFTYLNLMRFVALASVHLGEYRVWRATDILFTALLWVVLGQNRLYTPQLAGIALVFAACMLIGLDEASTFGWNSVVVLSIAAVSSLGLVTNDLSYKADAVPFMIQNAVVYVLTTMMGLLVVGLTVPLAEVTTGVSGFVFVYMGFEMVMGLCVACVLKYANALIKSMASTWLIPLELVIGHYFVGTPLTVYTAGAAMLAGLGNLLYRVDGAPAASTKLPASFGDAEKIK